MGDEGKQNEAIQTTRSLYFQEENHLTLYCPWCGEPGAINVSDFLEIPKEEVKEIDMEIRCPALGCNTPWKLALEVLHNLYELQQKLCSQYSEEEHSQGSPTHFFIIVVTPP
ncbi:MAG TPA: hypothetical protein ENH86_00770 [Candidatus Jorgensenbacteria bacterium]|nr:hypothetical protein [Candidatus Jorgensenbacteria bacterium]